MSATTASAPVSPVAGLAQAEHALAAQVRAAASAVAQVGTTALPLALADLKREAEAAKQRLAEARQEALEVTAAVLADLTGWGLDLTAELEANALCVVAPAGLEAPAPVAARVAGELPAPANIPQADVGPDVPAPSAPTVAPGPSRNGKARGRGKRG